MEMTQEKNMIEVCVVRFKIDGIVWKLFRRFFIGTLIMGL